MAAKSTQVFSVKATRKGAEVVGRFRIIKHAHPKDDPAAEGVPQREVLIMDESGALLLRITKYFRHLLLESNGEFETTNTLLKLTPGNVQLLAAHLLAMPGNRKQVLPAALARIEYLQARATPTRQENRSARSE